jgi:hypothetical protein
MGMRRSQAGSRIFTLPMAAINVLVSTGSKGFEAYACAAKSERVSHRGLVSASGDWPELDSRLKVRHQGFIHNVADDFARGIEPA